MDFNRLLLDSKKNKFLFEELVKRDFKKKYKRTILGFLWSMLSPLCMLGVLVFIFSHFFGRDIKYYPLYILSGQIVFAYFSESTNMGMVSLANNSSIFTKINVPKYLFVLSRSISAFLNFILTLVIFACFVLVYDIQLQWDMIFVLYPIICLFLFNYGIALSLSALFIFFRDLQYLYSLLLQLVMYGSAIFYSTDILDESLQFVFYINPIYVYISYIRELIIYNTIPSLALHLACLAYALIAVILGWLIYKRYDYKFVYYV